MNIQYNKNEVIAAARYIQENKPSSKVPSDIPRTDRGYRPERGEVDEILMNIRSLAKENKGVFEDIRKKRATGDTNIAPLWQKWIEVMGVGGYWLIANIEGDTINFAIAVTPWFGEGLMVQEEV
jgi:hypothetical protein